MNTYKVEYNGITIIERVLPEDLDKTLKQVRGLVWLSGKKEGDIKVSLNNN
jgi:methionine salvage enolase-phosphatase E1